MKKTTSDARSRLAVFRTDLGWMALVGSGGTVKRLTFGHASAEAAVAAVAAETLTVAGREAWNKPVIRRLKAYASGAHDDFHDVDVDLSPLTEFQRRVLRRCRRIPYGETLTYGQLAAKTGSARAARAIGNCMAANPVPIVIPCHRVVAANGRLGGYSAAGGVETKRRLLKMEVSRSTGS